MEVALIAKRCALTASMILWSAVAFAEDGAAVAQTGEAAGPAATDQEADLAAAEEIFTKSCRACHGNKAQGASSYPRLADLEPDYIADKLRRYRSGEKFGPNSILMIQNAKKLSDEDIANISVYVATAFD